MDKNIRNSFLSLTIKTLGAELSSIKSATGREYLWEADPNIWGRHSPVLFPIVGKLAEDKYNHLGKSYSLKQHGFARDMDFALVKEDETGLSLQLLPTPETKKVYPFDFSLMIHYRLVGNVVEVQYEVENKGDSMMPFSIGAHPGFAMNWGKDDRIDDYFLAFEKVETADTRRLDNNALLSEETERVLDNEKVITLKEDLFDRNALILLDLVSEKVSLCSYKHKNRVTIEFSGFPFLGIWSKPKAPYLCIEPWYGYVDPAGTDGILVNKPDIIKLAPGAVFSSLYRIVIEE